MERLVVIEIGTKLIRREMSGKRRLSLEEKRARLNKSAEIMLTDYTNDENLTALRTLDGEDFDSVK